MKLYKREENNYSILILFMYMRKNLSKMYLSYRLSYRLSYNCLIIVLYLSYSWHGKLSLGSPEGKGRPEAHGRPEAENHYFFNKTLIREEHF